MAYANPMTGFTTKPDIKGMFSGITQILMRQNEQKNQYKILQAQMLEAKRSRDIQQEQFKQTEKRLTDQMKIDADYKNALAKNIEAELKLQELGVEQQAELAEFEAAKEPTTETRKDVIKRGAGQITEGITPDMSTLNKLVGMARNVPSALQTAAAGPQTKPGMTYPEFYKQETAEGVAPEALALAAGAKEPELTPVEDLKNIAMFAGSKVPWADVPESYKSEFTQEWYDSLSAGDPAANIAMAFQVGQALYAGSTDVEPPDFIKNADAFKAGLYAAHQQFKPRATGTPGGAQLAQGRSIDILQAIVINGGRPTDAQFEAAFGYLPTDDEKKEIVGRILDNYEASQSTLIMPPAGG